MNLEKVKRVNGDWFSIKNRKIFNDIKYGVSQGKSGNHYLVRSTYGWSDMFGGPKKKHYKVNFLLDNGVIGCLVDETFRDRNEVNVWLRRN